VCSCALHADVLTIRMMLAVVATLSLTSLVSTTLQAPRAVIRLSAAAAPAAESQTPFEDWAESTGINAPKLAVTGKGDLRGVIVLDDVEAGEELCCVPRTTCLDLSAVDGSGSPCEALIPSPLWVELRWYERLACWLLAEERRGQASPIWGYLGYLPRPETFADSPLEWSDDELSALGYPPVVVSIREQYDELRQLHAAIVGGRGGALASTVTFDDLKWAMQLVLSRAFTSTIATPEELARRVPPPPPPPPSPSQVAARMWFGGIPIVGDFFQEPPPPPPPPNLGDGLEMAMMPMLDTFNHQSRAKTTCAYDGQRNSFVMTSTTNLKKGDQAYISYGDKSNDELLQLFGFVENENPFDVFLSIGMEDFLQSPGERFFASPAAMEARFQKLYELGLGDGLLGELQATGAPPRMMHALRVLMGTREELDRPKRLASPASLETEERVWAVLRGYCKMARAAMGGPRKADLSAAKAARRSGQERAATALSFRAEKKRLLSELENRLLLQETRSRKAGKVVKFATS